MQHRRVHERRLPFRPPCEDLSSRAKQALFCAQGYAFGVLSAFLSALAAVYTEWVMKRNSDSLYWQNMQLYTFGVAFNALGLVAGDLRSGAHACSGSL